MSFGILDLTPEREPFELRDGELIYFISFAEFSAHEKMIFKRIRKRVENAQKMFEKASTDEQRMKAQQMEDEASRDMVRAILPELPDDEMGVLKSGQIDMIIRYWTDKNITEKNAGNLNGRA